jgi:predicted CXXCH cytochrome family protein
VNVTAAAPACSACHQEHRGRVRLAAVEDGFCVQCHGDLKPTPGPPRIAAVVGAFPSGHPEFAAVRNGSEDPARLRFNHAVHLKPDLRGPAGPEQLACDACHRPEVTPGAARPKQRAATGRMAPIRFASDCARCHPLFFDERVAEPVPHDRPELVRRAVVDILTAYIAAHPAEMTRADSEVRRVPLNFPRPPETPARTPAEWIARRASADERLLWNKTCAECHEYASPFPTSAGFPAVVPTHLTAQWMPRAAFDHTPHQMVDCASCHAARTSTKTADVLLPGTAVCATCHAGSGAGAPPAGRADSRCVECHAYHDWTKQHPVKAPYSVQHFKE